MRRKRRQTLVEALFRVLRILMFVLGFTTVMLWLLVENYETIILYFAYVLGYTCVILFQVSSFIYVIICSIF